MAQDKWFVINGVHNQGPFVLNKLKQMAMENDFSRNHRFWRPGMKESISRTDFFTNFLGLGLPEIPVKRNLKEVSLNSAQDINFNISDFLDNSESEVSEKQTSTLDIVEPELPVDLDFNYRELKKPPPTRKKLYNGFKYLLAFTALVIISTVGYYSMNFFKAKLERPAGIRADDFNRAMECYQKKGDRCFSLVVSKDYSNLYLVTNKAAKDVVSTQIKLVSGPDDNFSLKNISLKSTAPLSNHAAYFRLLEFDEGINLVPGRFNLSILMDNKVVQTTKDTYLGHIDEVTFNKQLKELRANLVNKRIRPWRELEEKYQTLSALLISIRAELKSALYEQQFKDWQERSEFFGNAYRTKFGHMFTAFVLSNDDSKDDEEKKAQIYKKEVMTHYEELETLAKSLGKITIESISVLKSLQKLSNSKIEQEKKKVLQKFEELQSIVVNKKNLISAKVLALKQL